MRRGALALVLLAGSCGPKIADHPRATELTKHLPAALEAARPKEGDPRTVHVRVWVDEGVRAAPKWKEEITDQLDYASQLLVPLVGAKLVVDSVKDWNRTSEPNEALKALALTDKGDDVTWVIGYITAGDKASKAMSELGMAEPLGRHVVVRAWSEKAEMEALASKLPDLNEAERAEVISAHKRHKQTVVLLHELAATLGAIGETDAAWIQHPSYSPKQNTFSDRNRELIGIGIAERLGGGTDQTLAKKLLEAIEKNAWGGWVSADHDAVTSILRNTLDAQRAGRTAAAVPAAAYDEFNRIRELAKRGQAKDALVELDNLLTAYPGNAAMHQLKCEILLANPAIDGSGAPAAAPPAGKPDPKKPDPKKPPAPAVAKGPSAFARAACDKAADLAQGDPSPHIAVAEALAAANDVGAARAELAKAEERVKNLDKGEAEAWKRIVGVYFKMGALTWTEEALAKAKLDKDPLAQQVALTRARFGVPRGKVAPDQEGALVAAVKNALNLSNASKYADAERAIEAGEKKWPGAAGFEAVRCDVAFRSGQIEVARAACSRALARDPNESWALYMSAAIDLRDATGTKSGIDKLKLAIAVDPELGQAWRTLAKVYRERDREKNKPALDQLAKDYLEKFGSALPP